MNVLPHAFLEPHTSSMKGLGSINLKVQGLADGKLSVLFSDPHIKQNLMRLRWTKTKERFLWL